MPPSRDYTVKKLLNTEEVGKAERAEKGAEKGRSDANANIEGSASDGARGRGPRGNCELGPPIALTVLGGLAVVMLQER